MTPDKADITAAADRMRDVNAALSDWDRIRKEGEQISREEAYQVLTAEIAALRAENERLRLTDAEREAVELMAQVAADPRGGAVQAGCDVAATLRGLLDRTATGGL